ncbi:MAG: hypothetical protein ACLU0O_02460 [Collinsella sp.]
MNASDAALRYDSADVPQCFAYADQRVYLLYKDTSLLAAVGVVEIVMNARTIVATTGSITVRGCRPVLSGHHPAARSLGERS